MASDQETRRGIMNQAREKGGGAILLAVFLLAWLARISPAEEYWQCTARCAQEDQACEYNCHGNRSCSQWCTQRYLECNNACLNRSWGAGQVSAQTAGLPNVEVAESLVCELSVVAGNSVIAKKASGMPLDKEKPSLTLLGWMTIEQGGETIEAYADSFANKNGRWGTLKLKIRGVIVETGYKHGTDTELRSDLGGNKKTVFKCGDRKAVYANGEIVGADHVP